MKLNRKVFFRIHSWIGIKMSILFFIVCSSGTLATLSHEMDWLFIPEIRASYQEELADRNTIVANIKEAYPTGRVTFWAASNESYLCDIVSVKVNKQQLKVFVNQYTGEVQGHVKITFQRFFRDLHYYLFIPFQVGHFTVLMFGFMLFISTVTALLFYKKWYKKLFDLKRGKGKVVLFRSLHRLVGVWSIPFTILFSATGIWYFVERTDLGDVSKTANPRNPKIEMITMDSTAFANLAFTIDYNKIIAIAKKEIPNLKVKNIRIPRKKTRPIYVDGVSDIALVRDRANRVWIHPTTFEIVGSQKAKDVNTVTWLNDLADPLHFGYWGGLTTKIIWFFGGSAISGLVLTGIWISLKRKIKNTKKAKAQKLGVWKYINWIVVITMFYHMYNKLITRYQVSTQALIVITLGWTILGLISWYIFVYQMKKSIVKQN